MRREKPRYRLETLPPCPYHYQSALISRPPSILQVSDKAAVHVLFALCREPWERFSSSARQGCQTCQIRRTSAGLEGSMTAER